MTSHPPDPPDDALVDAIARPPDPGHLLTRAELTDRTGVPPAVLEAIEREGFLVPVDGAGGPGYTHADVAAVEAGMALLDAGLPLGELLDLARRVDERLREVADHAVDLFVRFVRDPVLAGAGSDEQAVAALVDAFEEMLPAAETIVGHHFRQLVLTRGIARAVADG